MYITGKHKEKELDIEIEKHEINNQVTEKAEDRNFVSSTDKVVSRGDGKYENDEAGQGGGKGN